MITDQTLMAREGIIRENLDIKKVIKVNKNCETIKYAIVSRGYV